VPHLPPPSTLPPGSQVVAYLRDSGHEDQDLSIPQQESEIRRWAQLHNLVRTRIFKDEARRGSSVIGRDDLHAMMNAFRHGCPERGVVVWKYNRFARNVDNAQFYRAEIRSRGYVFHSLNDQIPEGPAGRIFEALIDYKDEQFLTDLSIDVKRGLRDLVTVYHCVPGVPPRGFMRQPVTIGNRRDGTPHIAHRWVPDPDIAPLVLEAFEMRSLGASLGEIQKQTALYGSINSYQTFWSNRLYIGTLEFGGMTIENYCDPIVPLPVWDAVQKRQAFYRGHHQLQGGSASHPRRQNSRFLLSGIARCARCGSPLYGHSSPQRNGSTLDSYFCTRAYRKRDCSKTRIPRQVFEDAVLSTLTGYILLPETMRHSYQALVEQQAGGMAQQRRQRSALNGQLGKVRRALRHITSAIAESGHSKALLDRLAETEVEENELLTRIAELEASALRPLPAPDLEQLKEIAANLPDIIKGADIETLRTILRGFVDHVDIQRDGDLLQGTIYYYYPPPEAPPPKAFPPPESGGEPTVPSPRNPSGPLTYRHSLPCVIQTPARKKRPG
jgi:hypothetical protein